MNNGPMLSFARSQKSIIKLFFNGMQIENPALQTVEFVELPEWSINAFENLFQEHTFYRFENERLKDEIRLLKEQYDPDIAADQIEEMEFEKTQPEDGMKFMIATVEEEIHKDFPKADLDEVIIRKAEDDSQGNQMP